MAKKKKKSRAIGVIVSSTPGQKDSASTIKDGRQSKCWIMRTDTKIKWMFQFAPTNLDRGRSVNFTNITSPGMPYPLVQYTSGEAQDFSVDLVYNTNYYTKKGGAYVYPCDLDSCITFLDDLVPPYTPQEWFEEPPVCRFAYGTFNCKVVVTGYEIKDEVRDTDGRPISATFTLSMRRV